MDNPSSFWMQAQAQGVCAKCKRPTRDWEAHHVIQKQRCRREHAPQHSPDNALRLCSGSAGSCHVRHTTHQELVPLACLRDENIEFAVRWLTPGPAYEYLRRYYAGSDPRVDQLLQRAAA